ncbi:MAG: hypothetical protein RL226_494, partial [Bacteroidota bacterium]
MSLENENNPQENRQPKKQLNFYWIYAIIGAVLFAMLLFNSGSEGDRISYDQFRDKALSGEILRLVQNGERAMVFLKQEVRDSIA